MKTKRLFFSSVLFAVFCFNVNAQSTQSTNAIASTSYLGTSNNFDVIFKRQAISSGLITTNKTSFGLNSLAMPNSVSFGVGAGQFSSGTGFNTYIGQNAGKGQSATVLNSGLSNTFLGNNSGMTNTTGSNNIFLGAHSGGINTTGSYNIAIGIDAGKSQESGNNNIFIGNNSGCEDEGVLSGSIFIGSYAGFTLCTSNTLVIDNEENDYPLIHGDFALNRLKFNSKVGIGYNFGNFPTTAASIDVSGYNLFVKGGILTDEVRISQIATWADYVFAKDYKLLTLLELEDFIARNGHLPNVPSAQQVEEEGIALGEMANLQQEKIEELTLYIIQQNKINEEQNKEIQELKELVEKLISKK